MAEPIKTNGRHSTTRPALIVAFGFMGLTLYGLWAAYGAAPTSLDFLEEKAAGAGAMAGHGHGMSGGGGMSPDEFQRLVEEFVEANALPDGSVRPGMRSMAGSMDGSMAGSMDGMSAGAAAGKGEEAGHAHEKPVHEKPGQDEGAGNILQQEDVPIDVYLMAYRYGYEPDVLRLRRYATYNFRMMAVDIAHGASINFGQASQTNRLRAGVLVEKQMRFSRAGEFTIYCTVYCGLGHGLMQGAKIIVE